MAQSDRDRWDRRYANPSERKLKDAPDALLVRHTPPAAPGARALDLACGLGHNAIWLAEQGYEVDAFDISEVALRHARRDMLARGVRVNFVAVDLDRFVLPKRTYDVVCVFRFLDRALLPEIRDRVRPGGVIVYQTPIPHLAHPETNWNIAGAGTVEPLDCLSEDLEHITCRRKPRARSASNGHRDFNMYDSRSHPERPASRFRRSAASESADPDRRDRLR